MKFKDLKEIQEYAAEEGITPRELLKDYDIETDPDTVFMCKGEDWEEGDDEFSFYCGPKTTDGALSDSIYIDEYLQQKVDNSEFSPGHFDIGVAENVHLIMTSNKSTANSLYERLKSVVGGDFTIYEDGEE